MCIWVILLLTVVFKIQHNQSAKCSLRWRHNERDSVANHQPHDCLLNRLFRRRSKKTSKLRVTGLCVGNSPGTGEFPAPMASNAENVSIWWRHHATLPLFVQIYVHYRQKLWITCIWYFDLLEMAWHHQQNSIETLIQFSCVALRTKKTICIVRNERYTNRKLRNASVFNISPTVFRKIGDRSSHNNLSAKKWQKGGTQSAVSCHLVS